MSYIPYAFWVLGIGALVYAFFKGRVRKAPESSDRYAEIFDRTSEALESIRRDCEDEAGRHQNNPGGESGYEPEEDPATSRLRGLYDERAEILARASELGLARIKEEAARKAARDENGSERGSYGSGI